jgi:flagella basal body P-ring formation protein FlgA
MTSLGHCLKLRAGLLALALTLIAVPAAAETALRGAVTVDAASVRVGDLFSDAGTHAGEIVATAPAPGARVVFDASWLAATAQAHGLAWQPSDDSVSVEVTRAATLVDSGAVTRELLRSLAPGNAAARLSLDQKVVLYAPVGGADAVTVANLQLDPVSGRFSADVRLAGDDAATDPVHVSGRLVNVVQIPTLVRPMMPGDVVRPEDVAWMTVDVGQMPAGELTDIRDLVGHTPRHPLRAQEALRPFDLEMPVLVHRNDAVLIVLQAPGLMLTAAGKALDDGGRGELIRVVNIQSNRTIDATVAAPGQVELALPGAPPPLL